MKFLGTLAFGFSTIAAMIAALLAFGFQVKVESPVSPSQIAKEQQLSQCTLALGQAEAQVVESGTKVRGLEARLAESALLVQQTASQLSAAVAQRAQYTREGSSLAGGTASMVTGVGIGLLMFPIGFALGRRRNSGPPILEARAQEAVIVEPLQTLPLYTNSRSRQHAHTGPAR